MKNSQIKEIHDLLLAYAAGEYHKKGKLSKARDEIDMIITGVNMLGEELLDTTVSRDYFNSIYSSVADMIFVVKSDGTIQDVNRSVESTLIRPAGFLLGKKLNSVVCPTERSLFAKLKKGLANGKSSYSIETNFLTSDTTSIPVDCSCSRIIDKNMKFTGYLVVAEDITERKEAELRILRAVVETQQKEQIRVAQDLHDALGAELSTVKLLLSALGERFVTEDKKFTEVFESCKGTLDDSIKNLRSICFDLMPASLEKGNIGMALEELIDKHNMQDRIQFYYTCIGKTKPLNKSLEIAIYRISQEFLNNCAKHSKAKKVKVNIVYEHNKIGLLIIDNGKGFNRSNAKFSKGNGLRNMESRARAFNGTLSLTSKIGKGTKLMATFPLNDKDG